MNGVIGMTELLLGTELDSDQRDFVETVQHSAHSLLAIINDILDFSRIESGTLTLQQRAFIRYTIYEEVLEVVTTSGCKTAGTSLLLRLRCQRRLLAMSSTCVRSLSTCFPMRSSSPSRVKSTHVTTSAEPLSDQQFRLQFSVRDTGIGIPADKLESMFHAFSQVDTSYTRRYGGSDLGFAISRQLVERMGGGCR